MSILDVLDSTVIISCIVSTKVTKHYGKKM